MENYREENWVSLYQSALTELEQVKMSGRIEAAKTAIVTRMEKLCTMPGLHPEERQAIEDALRGLNVLRREEARLTAEQKRLTVEKSLEKLHSIGPSVRRFANDEW
jgi:hypothetical protein